jgi:hypothetical protein
MECLKGRVVQINFGAMYQRLGEVMGDRGEQVAVYFPPISSAEQSEVKYFAKYRLLCSEYAFCDVPACPGVYLIAKPFVEEVA